MPHDQRETEASQIKCTVTVIPHFDRGLAAMGGQQVAVQSIVAVLEERPGATIATLRDMVRMTGNDDASKAGHPA
jgi:hypothetical protein